jgi:hypothetical protein
MVNIKKMTMMNLIWHWMKNVTHPVDRTTNWCIGGCWFILASKEVLAQHLLLLVLVNYLENGWLSKWPKGNLSIFNQWDLKLVENWTYIPYLSYISFVKSCQHPYGLNIALWKLEIDSCFSMSCFNKFFNPQNIRAFELSFFIWLHFSNFNAPH